MAFEISIYDSQRSLIDSSWMQTSNELHRMLASSQPE
ncbi:hypothetical protein SLEP1_g18141 [Rubroshorea leprosula]|uniref:Uncharacterized protein n=1 Tax=Rubroshorea leprosula TaxID=152421 RepID=A0AAV5J5N1_9ROSI|nr:hypothetical protein SLEP1_g18141 [Rubroshorea leprosula]